MDENMSLWHIKAENVIAIEILYDSEKGKSLAEAVGYGIEEEGLPYSVSQSRDTHKDACEFSAGGGLGVAIGIKQDKIAVFCRQLKKARPIFEYAVTELETAKTIGKNAARIIKNKPFIDL